MPHRQNTDARARFRAAVAALGLLAVAAHAQAPAQPFPQRLVVRLVAKSPPDGHVPALVISTHVVNGSLMKSATLWGSVDKTAGIEKE